MALPMEFVLGGVTVATATAGASQDISALTGPFLFELDVIGLTSVSGIPACTVALQDSVDGFSTSLTRWAIDLQQIVSSPIPGVNGLTFRVKKDQLPNLRAGVTSAGARVNVTYLAAVGGSTPSLEYAARFV